MTGKGIIPFFVIVLFMLSGSATAGDTGKLSGEVEEPLRRMCKFLSSLDKFGLRAESSMEVVLDTGQKLHLHRSVDLSVRRPNKLRAESKGDLKQQRFYYNGSTLALYEVDAGFYAIEPAPSKIDAAMDFALETFHLTAPMVELIYNSPYERLIEGVQAGYLIGESTIEGIECLHLAFRKKDLDWQLWIEKDPERPFPKKVVITDNQVEGFPQFTGVIGNWNTNPSFPDEYFEFTPPENAKKIEFLKKKNPEKIE